ncbi:glycosyltransferase family 39 protein [Patescibacteria group bacterium]|nr:glycosyltransferase family 39 protein [Patescibacteria group bacterium]
MFRLVKLKNKKDFIFFVFVAAFFIFFIFQVSMMVFYRESWVDELMHLFKSMSVFSGDFVPFKDIIVEYPPLYLAVFGIFQYLFGPSLYVGRIVTACFYALILFLMFLVARKFAGKWWALSGVVFMSSNFLLVGNYASAGFYSLAVLPLMLAVWIETLQIQRWRKSVFCGISFGFMMLARTNMLPAILVYIVYLFFLKINARDIFIFLFFVILTLVLGYFPIVLGDPALAIAYIFAPFHNFGPLKNLPPSTIIGLSFSGFLEIFTAFLKEYYSFLLLFISSVAAVVYQNWRNKNEFLKKESFYVFLVVLSLVFIVTHYCYWRLKGNVYYANYFMPIIVLAAVIGLARFLRKEVCFVVIFAGIVILNFAINIYRTDVLSSPLEETDIQRVERGARFIKNNTEESSRILSFDNSIYHIFTAGRKTYAPLINRNFLYFPVADTETVKRLRFYNFEMLKQWFVEDADYVALQKESWRDMFVRTDHWGGGGKRDDEKINEIYKILGEQYEFIGSELNVYPRKYTDGNDGGTLLLYKHVK